MFKPRNKTVVLFVHSYDGESNSEKRFVECTTVGANQHYKDPQEFIVAFQKMYTKFNNQSTTRSTFTIENVVIE